MRTRISIGVFAKMTHLSVKALRHYHDVGVLDPAEIDTASGYRYYEPGQIVTAQVIRRFRNLGMPLEDIRMLLTAPDVAGRTDVIITRLARMESQLSQTQAAVASLRSLLERPRQPTAVEHRSVGPAVSVAIAERVAESALADWRSGAFGELYTTLAAAGVQRRGCLVGLVDFIPCRGEPGAVQRPQRVGQQRPRDAAALLAGPDRDQPDARPVAHCGPADVDSAVRRQRADAVWPT